MDRIEYFKNYGRKYYQKNKEKLKKARKEYYYSHIEEEKESKKRYDAKNKDMGAKERYLKYIKKHGKERINFLHKRQYHDDPEHRKKVISRNIMKDLKIFIIPRCGFCKTSENLQIHHHTYPTNVEKTLEAIDKKLIVFFCKPCHLEFHKLNAPLLL